MAVHIGEEIEKKVNEAGMKIPVFAKKINTGTRNVYAIFSRLDINVAMLAKISKVLDFNFFQLYDENLITRALEEIPEHQILPSQHGGSGVTLSINVRAAKAKMDQFSNFLGDLEAVAEKYQYQIL